MLIKILINRNGHLPPEILEIILLELSVSDINQLCFTNQYLNHICQKNDFWVKKFNQDGLLLLEPYPNTLNH